VRDACQRHNICFDDHDCSKVAPSHFGTVPSLEGEKALPVQGYLHWISSHRWNQYGISISIRFGTLFSQVCMDKYHK
jgi:hypothetical protein